MRPKVLMATTIARSVRGGLLPFARHFRALGWHVDAAANGISACEDCRRNFDSVWDLNWSRNPIHPGNLLDVPQALRELVRRGKYDLVHVHTPVAAFVSRYSLRHLRRELGCKIVYTAHGFHFHPRGGKIPNYIFAGLERIAGRWTDHLVTINETDFHAAARLRLVPPSQLHLMAGIGVDTQALRPERIGADEVQRIRQELGISAATPLFTMAAEFIRRKRHGDLLNAFARMQTRSAHLALPGGGDLIPRMKNKARQLGISDRVHFLGFRKDVPAILRASMASVLPSEQEGLPLAVMESLSLGVPVIGSRIRGTQDLLAHGAGLLFETGNVSQLATALDSIVQNRAAAHAMSQNAIAQMGKYDIASIVQHHEELYRRILSQ